MLRTRKTAKVITAPRSKLPLFFCFGVGFVKRQHVLFSLWIFVIWIEREREMLWVSSGEKWLSLKARKESILLSLYNFFFLKWLYMNLRNWLIESVLLLISKYGSEGDNSAFADGCWAFVSAFCIYFVLLWSWVLSVEWKLRSEAGTWIVPVYDC